MARFSSRLAQIAAWVLLPLALAGCLRVVDTSPLQPTPPGAVSNNPQPTATQEIAAVPTEQPSATPVIGEQPTEIPSPTSEQPVAPTDVTNQQPTEIPSPTAEQPTPEQPTTPPIEQPTATLENVQPTQVPPPTDIPPQPTQVPPPTDIPPQPTEVPPPTDIPPATPTEVPVNPTETLPAGGGGAEQTGTLPAGGGGPEGTAIAIPTNAVFYAPAQDGAQGTIDDQCRYTVVKNDRLIRIGLRFNRTIAQLMTANHLLSAGLIYPDQKLIIPDCQLP